MRLHRFAAIALGSATLAACSSMNLDALKPQPLTDTVRFESEPPGAEAKVSNGQTCTTPCSLALPASGSYSVVFSLNGYEPESDNIELITEGNGTPNLRPNPVLVELTPAPPPPKKPAAKKPAAKKPVARKKPVAKKKPAAPAKPVAQTAPVAPAAPAAPVAQSQPPSPSPWPATPPPQLPQR
ncbi:MAG TPA: PEGA domain-containing protein [Pseudolabrys sp.]|nr:PEGA domain-containing protein [Pseudolabrys sp.]